MLFFKSDFFPLLKGRFILSQTNGCEDLIGLIWGFESATAGSFSGVLGPRTMPTWALRKYTWTWHGDGEESNPATHQAVSKTNWSLWTSWMVWLQDFKPFVDSSRNTTFQQHPSCSSWLELYHIGSRANNCLGCLSCGRNQRRGRRECIGMFQWVGFQWKGRSKFQKDYSKEYQLRIEDLPSEPIPRYPKDIWTFPEPRDRRDPAPPPRRGDPMSPKPGPSCWNTWICRLSWKHNLVYLVYLVAKLETDSAGNSNALFSNSASKCWICQRNNRDDCQ